MSSMEKTLNFIIAIYFFELLMNYYFQSTTGDWWKIISQGSFGPVFVGTDRENNSSQFGTWDFYHRCWRKLEIYLNNFQFLPHRIK